MPTTRNLYPPEPRRRRAEPLPAGASAQAGGTSTRRSPGEGRRNRGFTLLELMVVMAIISILISMVVGVIWGMRRHYARVDAKMTMKQLRIGMVNLKQNNNYDPMLPIGVWTSGQTVKGAASFKDLNRDFGADGVVIGDELYLLGGVDAGKRTISGIAGSVLSLDGSNFGRTETGLDYFILKGVVAGDITYYPEVDLGKELDPNNKVWKATYTPHMNGRRLRYYTCKPKRIQGGNFLDPWGHAYAYELVPSGPVIVERIRCAGADGKFETSDDLEEVITEIPFAE